MTSDAPNTMNKFLVGAGVGERAGIVILNLPLLARRGDLQPGAGMPEWPALAPLTADEAINLAAWLVAVSGKRAEFLRLLKAVEAT